MAHTNKVIKSINNYNASRCVDIFQRPDGTFGFEEFRRDVEDARGWFPIGGYSSQIYNSYISAEMTARKNVKWLL